MKKNIMGIISKRMRKDRGLSQKQFCEIAAKVGVKLEQGYVSKIEKGDVVPPFFFWRVICKIDRHLPVNTLLILNALDRAIGRLRGNDYSIELEKMLDRELKITGVLLEKVLSNKLEQITSSRGN